MDQEKKNAAKRKKMPLSNSEALNFFFLSFLWKPRIKKGSDFTESELDRFRIYGYDLKVKQARKMSIFGIIFYLGLLITLIYFLR